MKENKTTGIILTAAELGKLAALYERSGGKKATEKVLDIIRTWAENATVAYALLRISLKGGGKIGITDGEVDGHISHGKIPPVFIARELAALQVERYQDIIRVVQAMQQAADAKKGLDKKKRKK